MKGYFQAPLLGEPYIALAIARKNPKAVIVSIACDRGDRYLSTGIFPA
jgi:S-sulfo-L-cysteine synthase (O-acetyl-L-serine-dependent)